jgi:hypothetical protein
LSHHDWTLAQLEDGELERQLLASAAQDAPPAGASERAFRELCADARALAALAALAPVPPAAPLASAVSSPAGLGSSARRLSSSALLLVLGAVAGAGAVALWRWPGADAVSLVPPLPPRRAAEPAMPELRPEPEPAPLASSPEGTQARAGGASAARAPGRRASADTSAERASRLAREVAALDAARASLSIGAGQGALRQIERYRAEFPDGELAADAEAVAIEALAVEGDHSALAAAAQRFLARYPRDPHAPRVRELAFIRPALTEQPAPAP